MRFDHSYLLSRLYCIVLYLLPVLNPKSYDGARVLEASGRPMLVIGRSLSRGCNTMLRATGDDAGTNENKMTNGNNVNNVDRCNSRNRSRIKELINRTKEIRQPIAARG